MAGKTAVIFYSSTGNTEAMAEAVAVGARSCGADVLLASVSDVDAETIGKSTTAFFWDAPPGASR